MCGLWGMASINTLTVKHDNFLKYLGVLSSTRGLHSTGVSSINIKKDIFDYSIIKKQKDPTTFMKDHKTQVVAGVNNIFLGHNRYATVGEIDEESAHPFLIDKEKNFIIGTHNGTLTGYLKRDEDFLSDSHKFYTNVGKQGLKKTLDTLGDNSAYCLVYVEEIEGRPDIKMFRNEQRSLFIGMTEDNKTVVWASEKRFLEAANFMSPIDLGQIISLKTNTLVRFDMTGEKVKLVTTENYLAEDKIKSHEKKHRNIGVGSNSGSYWDGDYWDKNSNNRTYHESNRYRNNSYSPSKASVEVFQADCDYRLLLDGAINIVDKKTLSVHKKVAVSNIYYDKYLNFWKQSTLSDYKKPYLEVSDDWKVITMYYPANKRGVVKEREVVKDYLHDKYDGWLEMYDNQEALLTQMATSTTTFDRKHCEKQIAKAPDINEMRRLVNLYKNKPSTQNKDNVVPFSSKK